MSVSENQAKEMRDAIKLLEQKEAQIIQDANDAKYAVAVSWYDSIEPATPTTRAEALTVFQFVEGKLKTETDSFRLALLRQKLKLANDKYKEIKKNG